MIAENLQILFGYQRWLYVLLKMTQLSGLHYMQHNVMENNGAIKI